MGRGAVPAQGGHLHRSAGNGLSSRWQQVGPAARLHARCTVTRGHSGAAGLRAEHRSTQTTPNMQPPQCQVLPTLLSPPWQPRGCEPRQLLLGTGTLLTPAQVCPAPSVRRCPLQQGRAQDRGEEGLGGATRGPWPWASSTSGPLDRMPGRGARPAARAAWPGTGAREGRVAAGDHRGTGVAKVALMRR